MDTALDVAVIPVAGLGTRLLPATKSQPKEMLPVGRKPVVQYVVEELTRVGITRVLFVTGPGKASIENHFDRNAELVQMLRESGKEELLAALEFDRSTVRYFYTRQRELLGLGHAVSCARSFAANQPFVVALGDSIIGMHAESDVVQRMTRCYHEREAAAVIAKFPASASDKDRCYHFCRAFVRAFRGKPPAEVQAAFGELVAARVDYALLSGTIATFRDTAEPETALALGKQVDLPAAQVDVHTESYKTLKRMRGEAEALGWLTKQLPRDGLASAAKIFYARDADELLWKLVDDPEHQGGSATWLLRAAAFVREEHPSFAHRQALVGYFSAHQTSADEQLGAALVGLIDGPTLLERAKSEADLSRAAYYLGARAEGSRDLHEAMHMYQLALCAQQRTPGRTLALDAVTRIHASGTSLDALAADPALGAVVAAAP
jgi:hypothetical protein